mgnify:CR=1 FL=1
MIKKYLSKCDKDTINFGCAIAKTLKKKDVICLFGSLGAGKTMLTGGICKGLSVMDTVNSPSFKLVNEYKAKFLNWHVKCLEPCVVYHIDLYRLDSISEINNLGLDEYIYGDGITIIEWAEKLGKENLPDKRIEIKIKIKNENTREIKWCRFQ